MDFLNSLNPEQREAVLYTDGPLLILAGAGSGKTRVIAYRVAYLVGSGLAEAHEVLAVTFTNKAAEEMRQRVELLLGSAYRGLWISTFHALCARLLRREATHVGLPPDFVIYDTSDQLSAVKQVLKTLQIEESFIQPRAALSAISRAKNSMQSPAAMAAERSGYREDQIARVYLEYTKTLEASGALDFDDLLVRTVELFEKAEVVRRHYAQRFRFVMVDEYQDTNRPQYLLMRRFAEIHRNLTVVGDPDQSIYGWRGADIRNILDFEHDFPEAKVVRLERNYRSTQVILDAASAVIANNRNRKEKRLWTDLKGGDLIVYARCGDELEEADFVAKTARSARGENVDDMVAVLYRTNAQSRVVEDAMRRENLVYRIIGSVRFYERKEVKDALAYLKLLLNPHDSVSLRRVINVPARGIGKGVMDSLEAAGKDDEPAEGGNQTPEVRDQNANNMPLLAGDPTAPPPPRSLWTALVTGLDRRRFSNRAAASLTAFRDLVLSLTEMAHRETVSVTIAKVLDQSGYLQDLKDERSEEAQGRIENLAELVSAAREYETREAEPSLSGFVDRLSLLSEADESQGAENARILLMTMHAAKGLEFPTVIITGLEEGLFPHSRVSDSDDDLEEERRLCYVGMTRARLRLFLTSASRRRVFGEYRATEPSRFIDEVPPELVQRYDFVGYTGYNSSVRGAGYGNRSGFRSGDRDSGDRGAYGRRCVRESEQTYAPEDEDQSGSASGFRLGQRVKHSQFGLGTVIGVEDHNDDVKVTVRFATVGSKRLLARYAKLEKA
ncbi:MAG: UvrD-helicase domain-containing protein [Acidobacteria bacterium]|nr:UvrD-helicase domain-containing protein [Acidobacteriota bacterium]